MAEAETFPKYSRSRAKYILLVLAVGFVCYSVGAYQSRAATSISARGESSSAGQEHHKAPATRLAQATSRQRRTTQPRERQWRIAKRERDEDAGSVARADEEMEPQPSVEVHAEDTEDEIRYKAQQQKLKLGLSKRARFHKAPRSPAPQIKSVSVRLREDDGGADASLGEERGDDERRLAMQRRCPALKELRDTLVLIPSDICELLPFLEGYTEEVHTAAEAGSRLGLSTVVMLNQHPRKFASLEVDVKHELRAMHGYRNRCVKGKEETLIVEGDDIALGLPWDGKVELLFIDTIHNADQLFREMQIFPQNVSKYILFHDTMSYREKDEELRIRRSDVPEEVKQWRGIRFPLQQFLRSNAGRDWQEEMSFTINNGLLILRRKSYRPKVHFQPLLERRRSILARTVQAAKFSDAATLSQWMHDQSQVEHLMLKCRDKFADLRDPTGRDPHPMLCGAGSGGYIRERFVRAVLACARDSDSVPLFNKATFPHGYANVARGVSFVLDPRRRTTDATANAAGFDKYGPMDDALEYLALSSAVAGAVREHREVVLVCYEDAEGCRGDRSPRRLFLNRFKQQSSVTNLIKSASSFQPTNGKALPQVAITTANALESFAPNENFGAIVRIYVHGTNLALSQAAQNYVPAGFELHSVLDSGVGVAVWHRNGAMQQRYVKV